MGVGNPHRAVHPITSLYRLVATAWLLIEAPSSLPKAAFWQNKDLATFRYANKPNKMPLSH